jgi:hypothetical protein
MKILYITEIEVCMRMIMLVGVFIHNIKEIFHLILLKQKVEKLGYFTDQYRFKNRSWFEFGEEAYEIEKFDGLETVLCGDIHKRAEFQIKGGKGYMIGSPFKITLVKVSKHGYGIYDVRTKEYKYVIYTTQNLF